MKDLVFLFPGQGSQFVGMGRDVFEASRGARLLFEEAEDILGFHITRLCFEGPEDELRRTINSQPAIVLVSLAILEAMKEMGFEPSPLYMAGHSLGEYTALIASGALSFEEGIRLVRERGRLMEEAGRMNPGGMAAIIGLDIKTLREICDETGAEIANINSPDQVVISGDRRTLAISMDLARARGARRVIRLDVSGAFHSGLMEPAVQGIKEAIKGVRIRGASIPIVANTTASPIKEPEEIKEELVKQIRCCVRWKESVEFMLREGASTFIEVGPGRVLSGILRRIDPSAKAISINGVEGIRAIAAKP